MGKYINPEDCSKEVFLNTYGSPVDEDDVEGIVYDDDNLLCAHVDNGAFTAALICYCKEELDYIKRSIKDDTRAIIFWQVERKHLEDFLV